MPLRRQVTRRFLATVLFTDIVGSTERAAELGDRAWRDLLERHHAVVRRELKAFHGREIGTAGDGFFALFEAPESAVRCAESIVAAVRLLGLQIRAGVHTGECEVIGRDVGGMAVHIGARVAALAGPGEVLVTGSVRDLMTGSDRHFAGGEPRELKGVADRWPVYRLVADEVNGDLIPAQRRPSMVPLYTRRQKRRLVAGIAGALVVALTATGAYILTRPAADVVVGENAVGIIGPGDDPRVTDTVRVGQRPTAVANGFGSVWVTNSTDDSVTRIDRRTRSTAPIPVGVSPSGVAVGEGSVWVANSGDATVTRIDPATSRPTTIDVRPGPTGIVVAFGSVWVTNALDASVTEIDPDTNDTAVIAVGSGPTGIAAGARHLWVTNQGDGTVTRFDPRTHEKDSPVTVGGGPVGIAVSGGAAWVTNSLEGSLSRIDVEDLSLEQRTLDKDGGAYGIAARGDDVWVSNQYVGTLMRVTARTFRLAKILPVRGAPLGLAYVGNDIWFTSASGGSALHRGGVLTIAGLGIAFYDGPDPAVFDPTNEYDGASYRLAALTYDGLVAMRRTGGVQGAVPVPDLATNLPAPTDGGLTYTFHLRKGIRYSTGALVLAGDIRRGIERTAMHDTSAGFAYAPAIVGGKKCKAAAKAALAAQRPLPECDLSEGIVADDASGTVTFHLVRPTPDFIHQLSLASASAVPQDTPITLEPGTFLPATGPYRVASYTPKQDTADGHGRLELVRNRYFREWSRAAQPDGYPDRIVLETGYPEKEAVERVAEGRADMVWFDLLSDADQLRARFGTQLHTSTGPYLMFMQLNTDRPPFDNLDARRALAYAIDRTVLADSIGTEVTCQLVPPDFPAYEPYCPFTAGDGADGTWVAPDLARAQRLVTRSGTAGAKVVVAFVPLLRNRDGVRHVTEVLDRLGYRASARASRAESYFPDVLEPRRFHAMLFGWGGDYAAASSYLVPLASCEPVKGLPDLNYTGYCDATVERRMTAAFQEQTADPGGRGRDAWAAVDRDVVDAAAIIPFGISQQRVLVSSRVGNVQVQPLWGALLAQMWVQ